MGAITRGIANNILGSGAVDGTDALTGTIPATNIGNPSLANLTTFPPSVSAGIPQVAGDPPAPSDGDVWYNTNNYKLRVRGVSAATGSWATGGSMNTARKGKIGGAGTQTATLGFGGNLNPPVLALTESYNGSSWTEVNDLNTARVSMGDFGTQTSALSAGGYLATPSPPHTAVTESWNGTSWTEVNDLNTSRYVLAGAGADNTSGLAFGGYITSQVVVTESWNGTSWTEVNDLSSPRWALGGAGTQTSALAFGGYDNAVGEVGHTEVWNGSSWTEVTNMNTSRRPGGTGATNTAVLAYGGPSDTGGANTETWDGTSWTEVGDLSTARNGLGSSGTTISALAFGGEDPALPGATAVTEEWTGGADNLDVDLA